MAVADPAGPLLATATELYEDLTLGAVRRWKEAHPGQLAVGYMPVYIPRPLIESLGCLPVAVLGGGDGIDIIRGDSYFQSYICHIPRSTLELALTGRLDALDGMLFPSTCDVIRNLGGMWKMIYPERYSSYVDLPQNFTHGIGGRFYAYEMRRVATELTERGARAYDADALWAAIEVENDRRAALEALAELRREAPWKLAASEAYLAVRAGATLPTAEHGALIRGVVAAARERQSRPYDNVRVVVVGAFCEQPPIGLIRTLEKAGCDVVADDMMLGLHYIQGPIPVPPPGERAGVDPVETLATAFIGQGTPTAARYIGEATKGDALIEQVRALECDGVVFAAASFCDPALLDQPMLEGALDRAGIPHTGFKYSENSGQFHTIREQAGAFSDAVKLWGTA